MLNVPGSNLAQITESNFTTSFYSNGNPKHEWYFPTFVDKQSADILAKRLFKYYNTSKTGKLDSTECQRLIKDAYQITGETRTKKVDQKEGENFIFYHEKSGGTKDLSLEDFRISIEQYLCGPGGRGVNLVGKVNKRLQLIRNLKGDLGNDLVEQELNKARNLFDMYDTNKDGLLSREEVRIMLQDTYKDRVGYLNVTERDIEEYFEVVGAEGEQITKEDYEIFILDGIKERNLIVGQSMFIN